MPGQTRKTDMTIGMGTHSMIECPHMIMGIFISGSPNEQCNNLEAQRFSDFTIHTCPHCPMGMAISSSSLKQINNLGAHRLGDVVTEFCGVGMTVSSSVNMQVG